LPVIGSRPVPYVDPFFTLHDDHRHAVTSELFPILTAPLLGAFGLRGVYILPAVGFLLALAGCAWTATGLDPRRSLALIAAVAGFGTPLLFYSLELWEHTPAVGVAACATAMFVRGRYVVSGLCFGVAMLLRPEAIWFAAGVLGLSRLLPAPPSIRHVASAAAGVLAAVAPLTIYSLVHFGTPMTPHLGGNTGALMDGWADARTSTFLQWFVPSNPFARRGAPPHDLWAAGLAAVVALGALLPGVARRGRGFLAAIAAAHVILVVLTAPNDGGGQWGPRYLLFAYIPLVILAADVLGRVRPHGVALVVAVMLAVGGFWTQRAAYRELRGAKRTYGRVLNLVEREVPPGGSVVTDLWWLDQVAAAAEDRQFFYAPDTATGVEILRRFNDERTPAVTIVRSRTESADVGAWAGGTCYIESSRKAIDVRGLVAIVLHRSC
jgi:hypothetical protein